MRILIPLLTAAVVGVAGIFFFANQSRDASVTVENEVRPAEVFESNNSEVLDETLASEVTEELSVAARESDADLEDLPKTLYYYFDSSDPTGPIHKEGSNNLKDNLVEVVIEDVSVAEGTNPYILSSNPTDCDCIFTPVEIFDTVTYLARYQGGTHPGAIELYRLDLLTKKLEHIGYFGLSVYYDPISKYIMDMSDKSTFISYQLTPDGVVNQFEFLVPENLSAVAYDLGGLLTEEFMFRRLGANEYVFNLYKKSEKRSGVVKEFVGSYFIRGGEDIARPISTYQLVRMTEEQFTNTYPDKEYDISKAFHVVYFNGEYIEIWDEDVFGKIEPLLPKYFTDKVATFHADYNISGCDRDFVSFSEDEPIKILFGHEADRVYRYGVTEYDVESKTFSPFRGCPGL